MPIDGGLRDKLEPGMILVARYKGTEYRTEIMKDADGTTRYRLTDGREFKSPSAAGSAVMGGIACNGWRFWSVEDNPDEPAEAPAPSAADERTDEQDAPNPCKRPIVKAQS